jgi:hypothetical protein
MPPLQKPIKKFVVKEFEIQKRLMEVKAHAINLRCL